MKNWLQEAAERGIQYVETINERRVFPSEDEIEALQAFDEPLQNAPLSAQEVIQLLDEVGSPATVATTGGRYFGFVNGAVLPAALAANWLATAWDQNTALSVMSPAAAKIEEVAARWVLDVLKLPAESGVGFVTGATMANFTCLAAARHRLLARRGWDVERRGLFGAPEIKVVVGEEIHASMLLALSLIGFGRERLIRVPVDAQGRMRADALPELDAMTLVCIQAGNVNTGAFDPAAQISAAAHAAGAWVHVDGAFGLWALSSPVLAHLAAGVPDADSWSTDGHKWLNVPYDSGLAIVRDAEAMRSAMNVTAAYLLAQDEMREPYHYTPEMSRRARGVEVWAALKSLGRDGLAQMIERTVTHAQHFAKGLQEAGYTVHNEVVINQVLVSFGDAETTDAVITQIQQDGELWAGRSVWQGHTAMRISVSSWATTSDDVERCLQAIIRAATAVNSLA
ncbi:MAG: aspartate aminotransferase family protein [Anaerolineae bacterium]|nr:aspartate aminotransferase family protein [Anaerolineae bacterium]